MKKLTLKFSCLSKKNQPFFKGICLKIWKMTPKKPNSANRNVIKLKLSNHAVVNAFIPGEGYHGLFQHSIVLIKHGKVKDLPGIKFKIVRNKFDCPGVNRVSSRSKYGSSKN